MKTILLILALTSCQAGTVLSLQLQPQAISGLPGQTVGWGFTMTSDPTYYVTVNSAFVDAESNPALGLFSDSISLLGGPTSGLLAPGAPDWVQVYDALAGTGFGQYSIDSAAQGGNQSVGSFAVIVTRYAGDPGLCGACYVDTQLLSVPFEVDVTLTPEPGGLTLFGWGLLAVAGGRLMASSRSRRRSSGPARERPGVGRRATAPQKTL